MPNMGTMAARSSKTESISLRLESSMLDKLRKESTNKQINFNTLCSQILRAHAGFNSNAARAGLISFPRALLVKMMDKFSEEEVEELAKHIATTEIADIIYLLRDKYDAESFLEVFIEWVRASGFPYNFAKDESKRVLVIQHDMSKKWSLYLAKLYEYVCFELGSEKPEFQTTKNTLVIKL